jgi:hypothetical protein
MGRVLPLTVLLLLAFAPAPPPKAGSAGKGLEKLQGEWGLVSWTKENGVAGVAGIPAPFDRAKLIHVDAEDGAVAVVRGGSLRLRATKTERPLWTVKPCPGPQPRLLLFPSGQRTPLPGVYVVEGDTLTFCYRDEGDGWPEAINDDGQWLLVLRRKTR